MRETPSDSAETARLLVEMQGGNRHAFEQLFERHRPALWKSVKQRLCGRIQRRIDASDVVQEAHAEAVARLDDYLARRPMPFRLWLLKTAHERLLKVERQHLDAAKRSVEREIPLPDRSSIALARALLAHNPSPSDAMHRKEVAITIRRLLARLSEQDREIIMLRNFAGLSNAEASSLLDIRPETGKKRYTRALLRLQHLFEEEGLSESSL